MKKLIYTGYLGQEEVYIEVNRYAYGNGLCIQLNEMDEGYLIPYATLTVNLEGYDVPKYHAFLDTNNCPTAEQFVVSNGLGTSTGKYGRSGYCQYPLYKFNREKLLEYCPDGIAEYEKN